MRRAADKIDRAVAQGHVGLVDRKDHLQRDVQALVAKEAEFDRGFRREIGIRDHVGHGDFHGRALKRHRRGAPLAREHRRAQQELPGARRVRGGLPQFGEIAPARFRVARLQALLVGDRLLLHEFDRDGAALAAVEIEQFVRRPLENNLRKLFRQIGRVLDAAVEAHAADRIVDVGGIAGQQHPPFTKGLRHALVRHVEIAMHDVVRPRRREKRLDARLHAGIAHDVGFGLLGARPEKPCATGRADRRPTP